MSERDNTAYFFLFHTIHDVLKAESALKARGTIFELVPAPRALSSDCGVCITSGNQPDNIISLLFSLNLEKCFFFNGKEYVPVDPDDLPPLYNKDTKDREAE